MGTICSPDNYDAKAQPNVDSHPKRKERGTSTEQNKIIEQSVSETAELSQSKEESPTQGLDPDLLDADEDMAYSSKSNTVDVRDETIDNQEAMHEEREQTKQQSESVSQQQQQQKQSVTQPLRIEAPAPAPDNQPKSGFQIVVTPAADTTNSETTDNTDDEMQKCQEFEAKRKAKTDPTLGGIIVWTKVADFSALLPQMVKTKLWNGVFKEKSAEETEEIKRISKLLRTFVMLQFTRV